MLILSCSSVRATGAKSRSQVLARRLAGSLAAAGRSAEALDLRDYRLLPCDMCEACAAGNDCVQADDSDALRRRLADHEALALVVPHYAGPPSRLLMLLEKLEERCYLASCAGAFVEAAYPFKGRPALVIAHGGMTEDYEAAYAAALVKPLNLALGALGFRVLSPERPLALGVKRYLDSRDPGSVCYAKEDDETRAEAILAEAARLLLAAVPAA